MYTVSGILIKFKNMGLSSNTIIHFTNSKDSLKGILKDNFKLYYSLEHVFIGGYGPIEFAVPMVSFCDIPLSEVKTHITKYGAYGIGLTKEWAERQKLNPVLYVEKDSFLSRSYLNIYKEYLIDTRKLIADLDNKEKSIADILRYIKNYQNDLTRGGQVYKDYRFSDEREWRYVIDFNEKINFILDKSYYDTDDKKKQANSEIEMYHLEFTPNDIKYVIIQDESEISEFLDFLKTSTGNKYTYNDVERLMTRLITTEQIIGDF
jgi:hypothetical protein